MTGESPSGQSESMLAGLAPGSVVAGYRVESRIGAGGMAAVFRAYDEVLSRTVALKLLAPALADDTHFRERFIRESRAVVAVDHPHIIPVYAAGEADGVLYLAMRFVPGGDLRAVLEREGPLTGDRTIALLSPVASALDAAHADGLIHRDVKPANILVDARTGRPEHPYLSDFGLVKGMMASAGLTQTGQFLGTPNYVAPEQISGKPARPQTDQYSLACVVYNLLTGILPFARDDSMAVLWAHMYDAPPSLAAQRPDQPSAVDEVLARALAKSPEDRYGTCEELIGALRTAFGASPQAFPGAAASPSESLPGTREQVPAPEDDSEAAIATGTVLTTVPGSITSYTDKGLAPDTAYSYQVIAVTGSKQSPASATLTSAHTAKPPLSAAVLNWNGPVTEKMISINPAETNWRLQPGSSTRDNWTVSPDCSSGPCDATLTGAYDGYPITTKLARSGSTYTGTAQLKNDYYCSNKSEVYSGALTVNITVNAAGTQAGVWTATSFSGHETIKIPVAFNCYATTAQLDVKSS